MASGSRSCSEGGKRRGKVSPHHTLRQPATPSRVLRRSRHTSLPIMTLKILLFAFLLLTVGLTESGKVRSLRQVPIEYLKTLGGSGTQQVVDYPQVIKAEFKWKVERMTPNSQNLPTFPPKEEPTNGTLPDPTGAITVDGTNGTLTVKVHGSVPQGLEGSIGKIIETFLVDARNRLDAADILKGSDHPIANASQPLGNSTSVVKAVSEEDGDGDRIGCATAACLVGG